MTNPNACGSDEENRIPITTRFFLRIQRIVLIDVKKKPTMKHVHVLVDSKQNTIP